MRCNSIVPLLTKSIKPSADKIHSAIGIANLSRIRISRQKEGLENLECFFRARIKRNGQCGNWEWKAIERLREAIMKFSHREEDGNLDFLSYFLITERKKNKGLLHKHEH